jgi:hypothetical protein
MNISIDSEIDSNTASNTANNTASNTTSRYIARNNSLNDMIISPYGIVYIPNTPTSTASNITAINNNYNKDIKNNTIDISISTKHKKVAFVKDTLPGREVRCAVTIIHSEKIFGGIMIYQIRCWASGRSWIIERRYRHFEALHKDILKEMKSKYSEYNIDDIELPSLPTKRWFESQRWLNKYDADYIENRKLQLQDYLRQLLKNPKISVKSKVVSSFLEYELHTLGVVDDQVKEGVMVDDETTRVSDIHFRPEEFHNDAKKLIEQLNIVDIVNQNIETFDKSDNEEGDSESTGSSYEEGFSDSVFTSLTQA